MSLALPDHTATDSSITFMAANAATPRQRSSMRASRFLRAGGPARVIRIGAVAEFRQAVDEGGRIDLAVAPLHRDAAVGEIHPRPGDVGHGGEAGLDGAHAAAAVDPVNRKLHAGDPAAEMVDEMGKIARFGHVRRSAQRKVIRFFDRYRRSSPRPASISTSHKPSATSAASPT